MPNYEQLLETANDNLSVLESKLGDFDNIYKDLQQLPKDFSTETKKVSEAFNEVVKVIDEIKSKIDNNIDALQKEIDRLSATDFKKLFKDLQKEFIVESRNDIAVELKKFENKTVLLQGKIDALHQEAERLAAIDLEKHFDKLQKTLSDLFSSITAINQNLNGIVQSVGAVQKALEINNKEISQAITDLKNETVKHLTDQDNEIKNNTAVLANTIQESGEKIKQQLSAHDENTRQNMVLLENKIQFLAEQNVLLKKEIKTNRIIQFTAFTILIAAILYILIKCQ